MMERINQVVLGMEGYLARYHLQNLSSQQEHRDE